MGTGDEITAGVGTGLDTGVGICEGLGADDRTGGVVAVSGEAVIVGIGDGVVGVSGEKSDDEGEGETAQRPLEQTEGVGVGGLENPMKVETAVTTETTAAMIPLKKENIGFVYRLTAGWKPEWITRIG